MSHHFDTQTAGEDPRINLSAFYLFRGNTRTVAMALTVNSDAGAGRPRYFSRRGSLRLSF